MSEELKACPFCGGEAKMELTTISSSYSWVEHAEIRCGKCPASMHISGGHGYHHYVREQAVVLWNQRHPNV